jgi:hypothetical protein
MAEEIMNPAPDWGMAGLPGTNSGDRFNPNDFRPTPPPNINDYMSNVSALNSIKGIETELPDFDTSDVTLDDYINVVAQEEPVMKPAVGSKEDFINKMNEITMSSTEDIATDPFKMSKSVYGDFNNPDYQNQFIDRYKAHSQYDKLGYSPFRDNESLYNSNTTTLDEISRAGGAMVSLVGLAFTDALTPSTTATNVEFAKDFSRLSTMGSSTVGGATGFSANLITNMGFSLGIIAELAMEEFVLMGAEAALATGSVTPAAPVAAPALAANTALMGARFTGAMKKLGSAFKSTMKLSKTLDKLRDVDTARKTFNSLTKIGKAGGNL